MELNIEQVGDALRAVAMFGVTDFERNWKPHAWLKFTENNYAIPIIAITCYLSFCFGVRRLMEGREPSLFVCL